MLWNGKQFQASHQTAVWTKKCFLIYKTVPLNVSELNYIQPCTTKYIEWTCEFLKAVKSMSSHACPRVLYSHAKIWLGKPGESAVLKNFWLRLEALKSTILFNTKTSWTLTCANFFTYPRQSGSRGILFPPSSSFCLSFFNFGCCSNHLLLFPSRSLRLAGWLYVTALMLQRWNMLGLHGRRG
jgi:hypothetical protein